MRWLLELPDHIANSHQVQCDTLSSDLTMLHRNVVRDMIHGPVISRELRKGLDVYSDAMIDEIGYALSHLWGTDTQNWREVLVFDNMIELVSRVSSRVFVGLPLCRDTDYLKCARTFAQDVAFIATADHVLPSFWRPIVGRVGTLYDMSIYRKIRRFIIPVIKERLPEFEPGLDYKKPDYSKHNDFIQWALHYGFSHDDPLERSPEMVASRLAVLNFAATHSSGLAVTNLLFDVASSASSIDIQQTLREEVLRVNSESTQQAWTKAALAKMVRVDSTIRESFRLWGFSSRGVTKMVVAPEGVTLPSGEHLPKGRLVGIPSWPMHHDESIYPNAYDFQPFRFAGKANVVGLDGVIGAMEESSPMVSTADNYLSFSHGRHAW